MSKAVAKLKRKHHPLRLTLGEHTDEELQQAAQIRRA